MLFYRAKGVAPRADVKPELVRGGYLHPVLTPAGRTVTDDYPIDHKHHHGIWNAWTSTEYEGRKPDFWNMGSRRRVARTTSRWTGPSAATWPAGF